MVFHNLTLVMCMYACSCSCSFCFMLNFPGSMLCSDSARFDFYRPISDVSSDLTIEVGASAFALHKVKKTICYSDKRFSILHGLLWLRILRVHECLTILWVDYYFYFHFAIKHT